VLDPFCGSGTTLVEAARQDSVAIGIDCNPIATLMSRFKLLSIDSLVEGDLDQAFKELDEERRSFRAEHPLHEFPGRDHWFAPHVQTELATLLRLIERTENPTVQLILRVALSTVINRVSYQDSETRYARIEREVEPLQTMNLFSERVSKLLTLLKLRGQLNGRAHQVLQADVMRGIPLRDESCDQIITSPPYANTMDYYLYHKQRMNVLGYKFKPVQRAEIGSRWEYSSMKSTQEKWEADYGHVLAEMWRVLKPRSEAIIVIGDSQIGGKKIDAAELTLRLAAELGFVPELLESVPMAGRSKSFNARFQRPNKSEHVLRLEKP